MKPVHAENNLSWLATTTPLIALVRIKKQGIPLVFKFHILRYLKKTTKKTFTAQCLTRRRRSNITVFNNEK